MRTVYGACHHDCPDSCGWVVTVEDQPAGPVAVKIRGNNEHPFSQGELCPKVNRFLERVYSPDRITTPLRRTGPKGSGQFEQITWSEALAEIRDRWTEIIRTHTAEAIMPMWDAGNQSVLSLTAHERFAARLGMSRMVDSVCGVAARVGTGLTLGSGLGADPMEMVHSTCIVLWGTNTRLTNRHLWPFIEQARRNGATVITIDPLQTMTATSSDWFVQPLPGTDVALMLGLANQWIANDRIDHDYIAKYTEGYEAFATEASAWTPERVANVCGLSPDDVVRLAATIADAPSAHFRTLIGAEHREQGGTFFQVLSILPTLLGSWRHRGGGYSRSVGTYSDLMLGSINLGNSSASATRSLSMNHMARWLNHVEGAPIKSILIWNANPVVSLPNADGIRRGLSRDDLFTIVHEQFMTDTAAYADIILPATTHIEADDVVPSWGSMHINYNAAAIPPVGECVSNSELFRRLSSAMGFDEPELQTSDAELLARLFAEPNEHRGDLSLDDLRDQHVARINLPEDFRPYANGGYRTPSGKAQLCGKNGAPTWVAATEGTHGSVADEFPLSLMTPKTHTRFLNASYAHLPNHGGREGGPYVELSEADAKERGLVDGDFARVFNHRASLELRVVIGTTVRPGVVSVPFGWHGAGHRDAKTANALTNDTITNVGVGVAYSDTMVEVAKL